MKIITAARPPPRATPGAHRRGEGGFAPRTPLPLNFQWGASRPTPHTPHPGTSRNRSGSKNDVDRPNGWAEIFILEPKSAKQHLGHDLAEIGRRGEGGFEPATARNREPRPRPLGHGGLFPLGNRPPGESAPRGITPRGITPWGITLWGIAPWGITPWGISPWGMTSGKGFARLGISPERLRHTISSLKDSSQIGQTLARLGPPDWRPAGARLGGPPERESPPD